MDNRINKEVTGLAKLRDGSEVTVPSAVVECFGLGKRSIPCIECKGICPDTYALCQTEQEDPYE